MWKLAIWLIRRSPGRPLGRRDPASICPDVEQQHLKALLHYRINIIVLLVGLSLHFSSHGGLPGRTAVLNEKSN